MEERHMSCQEMDELLPLIADDAIDPATDPDVFLHLAECPRCQEALAQHDAVTLALAGSQTPHRGRSGTVVQFVLPRSTPWLIAATTLVSIGSIWYLSGFGSTPAAEALTERQPVATKDVEILQVIASDRAGGDPSYLVRQGDEVLIISHGDLDGGDQTRMRIPTLPAANHEIRPRH